MSKPSAVLTSDSARDRFRLVSFHGRRLAGLVGGAAFAAAVPGVAFADASGAPSTTIVSPTNNAITSSVSRDGSRWVHAVDGATSYGLPHFTIEDVSTPTSGGPDVLESRDAGGAPAPGANVWGVLSTDGRRFAWMTTGTGLVPGVTDRNSNGWDVYVRDRGTGAVTAVSVRADGTTGDRGDEFRGSSADLRYLVLQSSDTDLVPGQNPDPQASASVVLADIVQGTLELVNVTPAGTTANSWAGDGRVSDDGRYVLFISNATNLTADGAYPGASIFLRDRQARTTRRLDNPPGATAGPNASCSDPSLSGDGHFAAFVCSGGVILAPGASGSGANLYVVDVRTGAVHLVTTSGSYPHLSGTGRFVSYNAPGSQASQVLCSGTATPCAGYVYVADLIAGTTSVVSVDSAGRGLFAQAGNAPAISDDGRYVTFSVSLSQNAGWTEALRDRGSAASIPVTVPPQPPTGVTATAGDHSATITWLKPASDGGSVILGYTVTASPGGQTCSTDSPDSLTCTITGLTNGVNYTFTVTARNAAGTSPPAGTPADQPTTVGTPPAPVTVLPPEPDPVDGTRVTVHWLAAQTDPNLPIIGYTVTAQPGGRSCSTTGELFCTITGLDPAISYTFTVVAINAVGPSPTTKPDPPTGVSATAGGYREAVVSWTAPTATGGTPISGYTAAADLSGGSCTANGATHCIVTGLTPGGTYTFTVTAINATGTSDPSPPSPSFTVGVDTSPPSVTGRADRDPNSAGWYHAPVTITWSAIDPPLSSGPPTIPSPTTVGGEGVHSVTSGTSCDPVGNCATGTYGPIKIDLTDPSIDPTISPTPNTNGWVNQPTTITFTCADALSGVASCPTPATVHAEGANQAVPGTAVDNAGNSAHTSATVNYDATAPTIAARMSQATNGNGWNNGDVTITFTCADPVSGIASCPTPVTLTEDGADQVVTGTATDKAGNIATITVTVSIDKTRPLITAVRTTANSGGWNNTDVTITYTCIDALSGIASCPAPAILTTEGSEQTATATATDRAGNTATATTHDINIDKTPPTITATVVGEKNAGGWYRNPPTVHYTCTDALSGIASCPPDITLTGDGTNQTITGVALDNAGNTAPAVVSGLNVDTTPPQVSVTGAANGTTYGLNQVPAPSCSTSDATSGVTTAATLSLTRTSAGAYTATCSGAIDRAGNTTSAVSITYTVAPTAATLTGLTNQYVSASGSPDANGVINDLDNKLAHNQICLYISKVQQQTVAPNPTLTSTQAGELIYWARILDPAC